MFPSQFTTDVAVTPVLITTAYTTGRALHTGVLTLSGVSRGTNLQCALSKITVADTAFQNVAYTVFLFNAATANTASTANVAWSPVAADAGALIDKVAVATGTAYTAISWQETILNPKVPISVAQSGAGGVIYAVMTVTGTPTYGATNALTVTFTFDHN